MSIEQLYNYFIQNPIICTDSRKVEKGCIYFSLKGDNFNGNRFAIDSIEQGAAWAIVDEKEYCIHEKTILVDNVLLTLQNLANYHRNKLGVKIIAITGTNGKTTTKELIKSVLSKKYKVTATVGNLNNHIGVPLTLLSFTKETELGIVEMGANHVGEIAQLCQIAEPDLGLITNIGKAHLEGFGSFEGVIKAKSELYQYIISKKGTLIVNADNEILIDQLGGYSNVFFYGNNQDALLKGELIVADPFLQINVTISGQSHRVVSQLVGNYNISNILAACIAGKLMEVPDNLIFEAIAEFKPDNNRSQLLKTINNTLLLDYYNANPTSLQAAIDNFSVIKTNGLKKVLVLGDMFELGADADKEHAKIVSELLKLGFENVFMAGKYFFRNRGQYIAFETTDEMVEYFKLNQLKDSMVLVKGSRGMKLEKVVEYL